jgi:hypothetical protein
MGRNYWNEKETNAARIERWRNTSRDAFGQFTGVPNTNPIYMRLLYYGENSRADYDYQESKRKRES